MKALILFIFTTIGIFANAQTFDAPILTNGEEEYVLKSVNHIRKDAFYTDSLWLFFETNEYKLHSFEIIINASTYPTRFYAAGGIIKGSCLRKILLSPTPIVIEIGKVKIAFNNDFLVLPAKYHLFLN